VISSHRNPLVKRIRKLQQKKYRQREGAFFVEGIRIVLTALEQDAPVETLVYAPDLLTSDVALEAIAAQKVLGRDVAAVTADVFQAISDRDNALGLGAVVSAHMQTVDSLSVGDQDIYIGLEEVSDPGNLGTIVRTADATGATAILLAGQSTDPLHPAAVRASMGAIFRVPIIAMDTMPQLISWARGQGLRTVATSAHAAQSFWEATYRPPLLLLFGSEGDGLAHEVLAQADLAVSIPMFGISSSLNLAVAAGLLLYEVRRSAPPAGALWTSNKETVSRLR
jgi:RNA methyltransferase, TrmH family